MIPVSLQTTCRTLWVLLLLWNLSGCAQVVTQSKGEPERSPTEVASQPSPVPEAPEEAESPVSPIPETRAKIDAPVSGVPETEATIEVPLSAVPETEATIETPVTPGPETRAEFEVPVTSHPDVPEDVGAFDPLKAEPPFYLHVVRWEGETLSGIAQWYTGSWKNWEVIARANSKIDPDVIQPGNRIQIPASLLKRREPMPRDFVTSGGVGKKTAPSSPAQTAPEEPERRPVLEAEGSGERQRVVPEGIELFGPGAASDKDLVTPEPVELFGPVE